MSKSGRPSSYSDEFSEQAEKLCKLGATDKELGDFFGVSEKTINTWKQVHPQFLQSIKEGKLFADANVANRLFLRAMGYEHPEVHVSNYQGEVTLTPLTKHYPPDSTAAIFWLKNRRPEQWRDKTEQIVTVKDARVDELSDNELLRLAAAGSNRTPEAPGSQEVTSKLH